MTATRTTKAPKVVRPITWMRMRTRAMTCRPMTRMRSRTVAMAMDLRAMTWRPMTTRMRLRARAMTRMRSTTAAMAMDLRAKTTRAMAPRAQRGRALRQIATGTTWTSASQRWIRKEEVDCLLPRLRTATCHSPRTLMLILMLFRHNPPWTLILMLFRHYPPRVLTRQQGRSCCPTMGIFIISQLPALLHVSRRF